MIRLIYTHALFYLFLSNILFGVFLSAQETATNELLDTPFFSEQDFADLELDDADLEAPEEILIDNKDSIVIDTMVVSIDNNSYENPVKNVAYPEGSVDPALVMKELVFRRGDVMSFALFKKKVFLSQQNLEESRYFYMESNIIEFLDIEAEDQNANKKLKVFVTVKQGFPYTFGGGNAYAVFGINHPFGLSTTFFGGGNRVEAQLLYDNLPIGPQGDSFGRIFMDLGSDSLFYWLAPSLSGLDYSALLYGTKIFAGFHLLPSIRIETGFGLFGLNTLDDRGTSNSALTDTGIPLTTSGGAYTVDLRNSLRIKQRLGHSGVFASYLQLEIPFMVGVAFSQDQAVSQDSLYGVVGARIEGQLAAFWGVHHAVRFVAGFGGNLFSGNVPFIAKTNLRGHFFDNTFVNFTRRGRYPDAVSVGNTGYVGSLEYRVGWFRSNLVSVESFLFFDVGAAANTYEDLAGNARYSVGPGLVLHFFSPVGLQFKTSYAFGGSLLGQQDGDPFAFSLEVTVKR